VYELFSIHSVKFKLKNSDYATFKKIVDSFHNGIKLLTLIVDCCVVITFLSGELTHKVIFISINRVLIYNFIFINYDDKWL